MPTSLKEKQSLPQLNPQITNRQEDLVKGGCHGITLIGNGASLFLKVHIPSIIAATTQGPCSCGLNTRDVTTSTGFRRISAWSIMGLHRVSKQRQVKRQIFKTKISCIGLLDTKLENDVKINTYRFINPHWNFLYNFDFHTRGRNLIGWDPKVWKFNLSKDEQSIHCLPEMIEDNMSLTTIFVYAHYKTKDR